MIRVRTAVVADPLARANVVEALAGPGAPSGVIACRVEGATVSVEFDDERTAADLIDLLIEIETTYVPARTPEFGDPAAAAAVAARGLDEPGLDPSRIIETYLP